MADLKEKHYWSQVQAALLAGCWESSTPGRSPKGVALTWAELFRKAKKHIKRSHVPEAASQTQYLSLLLSATNKTNNSIIDVEDYYSPFELGNECVIPEESRDDAQKAYDTLLSLNSSDDLIKQTLAFFAFALDKSSECLDFVSGDVFASKLTESRPTVRVMTADEKEETAKITTLTEVEDGDAWNMMESLRSYCLEGMAHERISPDSPTQALSSYDKGVQLLQSYSIPKSPPPRAGKESFVSFEKYRILWKWAELIFWRSIILSARYRNIEATLSVLRTYTLHSVHWPPSFHAKHRSAICVLYLRALILVARNSSSTILSKASWSTEMRKVVHEYQAILGKSTHFPKAGERNTPVEEFVDLCVAGWEAGGASAEQANWVLDILWWATRLTFNSPRIFRHMARILHVAGDNYLAVRVVRLYVQVVRKALETGTSNPEGVETQEGSSDMDTIWVSTLVQAARMLCRIPGDLKNVKEAEEYLTLARERLGNLSVELRASVDLADGICKSVMAIRDQEPAERSSLFSKAADLLIRSVEEHATPSACFHAALALSRPIPERDLEKAITLCRAAIEAAPREVRYWHLLALLEAKIGEWQKAQGVLEAAIGIADDVEQRAVADSLRNDGVLSKDYGTGNGNGGTTPTPKPKNGSINPTEPEIMAAPLLEPNASVIPPAATLLQPLPDHPPPTPKELFEQALQLRMTQLALMELAEGPDSVETCWIEVFDWYSQRRDIVAHGRSSRPSTETRLTPNPTYEASTSGHEHDEPAVNGTPSVDMSVSNGDTSLSAPSVDAETIHCPARASLDRTADTTNTSVEIARSPSPFRQERQEKERMSGDSQATERDKKGKRVQQMLKNQVHKQSARINTISKKIGHGVSKGNMSLQRTASAPDLHAVLTRMVPYQASSIHSRRRLSFASRVLHSDKEGAESFAVPSPPPPVPQITADSASQIHNARERRLLSDLWLMSAATFRRLEKLDQARGAIQEAETLDEKNENVWIQLGLCFSAQGEDSKAVETFQKALFFSQDSVPATLHLCQLYLSSQDPSIRSLSYGAVDLAAGMLQELTRGPGWDVSEAWYLLAKAYHMQGRDDRERDCLVFALGLAEVRGVRDIGIAIGWCL